MGIVACAGAASAWRPATTRTGPAMLTSTDADERLELGG